VEAVKGGHSLGAGRGGVVWAIGGVEGQQVAANGRLLVVEPATVDG